MQDHEVPQIPKGPIIESTGIKARWFWYTNHRGERRVREVSPVELWYGSTEHHPSPGFLLTCYDHEKGEYRDYALTGFIPKPEEQVG